MLRVLRVLALLSFVVFLAAATLGIWGRASAAGGATDGGADAGVAQPFPHHFAASKSFGGESLAQNHGSDMGTLRPAPALPEAVERELKSHRAELRACHQAKTPPSNGKLTLAWTIGADGKASGLRVTGNGTGDLELASCVLERVRSWRFPPAEDGGTLLVSFPFHFVPGY